MTVEPGLYYPGLGAVRIEDMVLVTKDGCRNLTNYPKVFELRLIQGKRPLNGGVAPRYPFHVVRFTPLTILCA